MRRQSFKQAIGDCKYSQISISMSKKTAKQGKRWSQASQVFKFVLIHLLSWYFCHNTIYPLVRRSTRQARKRTLINFAKMNLSSEVDHQDLSNGPQAGVNEGKWTPQEHALFLKAMEAHENDWKQIAIMVKTRNASQVRSHAQKYFNKKQNDEEKIGRNKSLIIGDENERTKTRSRMEGADKAKKYVKEPEPVAKTKPIEKEKPLLKPLSDKNGGKKNLRQPKKESVKPKLRSMPEIEQPPTLYIPAFTRIRPHTEEQTSRDQSYFISDIIPTLNARGFHLRMVSELNLYELIDGSIRKEASR